MNKKYIFMGPLYAREQDEEVKENQRIANSTASNVFQWSLLDGLAEALDGQMQIINALPVGTWPGAYRKLFLPSRDWCSNGIPGHETGCVNLPFLKQYMRCRQARKILRAEAGAGTEVIIYSAYMPYLKAACRLPPEVKVTVIVTDLPEYYDLGRTSALRKGLRKLQNRMIYRYLERVDRFVVLTDHMVEPLRVGNRPWMRMEGICDPSPLTESAADPAAKAILYSGTLHYQYGITNLLKAFAALTDPALELWICGSGEAEREIAELSRQDPRIRFFGFCSQQQVAQLRSRAAVLVNPRTNEGAYTRFSFPSKTMEYMASGKPVVMYRLDGIPEDYDPYLFYADGETDPVQGLKHALTGVLEHYDDALCRSAQARNFVLEHKNFRRQAQRMLKFIRENQ